MLNDKITRRSFLKILLGVLAGFLLSPLEKLLKQNKACNPHLKEAKYYTRGDNLAG